MPTAGELFEQLGERHGAWNVRKCHTALMACWREAYRNGWVGKDSNPFAGIRLPKVARSAGKLIDDADIRKLLAVADPGQEHTWIMLHIVTGARPGEIRTLRWSDVDLDEAVVTVTDEKHKGSRRPVDVTDAMVQVLREWHAEQHAKQPLCADPYLFSTTHDASTPWSRYYVRQRWNRLRERAGVADDVRLYDIRHTVNSSLADAGVESHVRGQRAGNSARVNEGIYSHASRLEGRKAAGIIGRRYGV